MYPESPIDRLSPPPGPVGTKKRKLILVIVVTLVVLLAGLVGLLWWMFNMNTGGSGSSLASREEAQAEIPDPQFTVGAHPYIYACSLLQRNDIAETLPLTLSDDRKGETLIFDQAAAYSPAPSKKLDMGVSQNDNISLSSRCRFGVSEGFNIENSQSVSLSLTQRGEPDSAETLRELYQYGVTKTDIALPSFKDSGHIIGEEIDKTDAVNAYVFYKNLELRLMVKAKNITRENAAPYLDALFRKIIAHVDDAKTSQRWLTYTGFAQLQDASLIDTCQALDFAAVSKALGGEVNHRGVGGMYLLEQSTTFVETTCTPTYTYEEDYSKRGMLSGAAAATEQARIDLYYPHEAKISIRSYAQKGRASTFVEGARKDIERNNVKEITIQAGDEATGFYEPSNSTTAFWVAKGHYLVSFEFKEGRKNPNMPYEPTKKQVTAEQVEAIFNAIKLP